MARIQALPLPPEGTPFMLVIDEAEEHFVTDEDMMGVFRLMREQTGARFILVTTNTTDVA